MTSNADSTPDRSFQEGYFVDAENAAEMARLMIQDRLLTQAMGELVPQAIDLAGGYRVLDIGCGPGGWLLDLIAHYPHLQGVGIDISHVMIDYAARQAASKDLSNIQFQVTDATQRLPFADQTFDLINGRILTGFLTTEQWPSLFQECYRITKPGGILRVTEAEYGFTSSAALDNFTEFSTRSFAQAGHSFSPRGRTFGAAAVLAHLLRQANYQQVQQKAYIIDFSAGSPIHRDNIQNLLIVYKLLQPLFVQTGLASQEELQHLYTQMEEEIQSETFCGLDFYLSAWGSKLGEV